MVTIVPILVALGAVAARSRVWISLVALATTYASMVLSFMAAWPTDDLSWIFFSAGTACGVAWGLGAFAHQARRRIRELQAKQERATEAVTSERARIAAELNGIITGALSRMRVEAASAREHIEHDRAAVVAAFAAIEAIGVEAMHELRRLLHVLHDDPGFTDGERAEARDDSPSGRLSRRLRSIDGSDIAITIGVIAATMVLTAMAFEGAMRVPASLFLGLTVCVLLWRHQFPIAVFILVIVGNAAAIFLFSNGDFIFDNQTALPAVLVALAAVAGDRSAWISIPALVIAWAYASVSALAYPAVLPEHPGDALLTVAIWMAALIAGRRRRRIENCR